MKHLYLAILAIFTIVSSRELCHAQNPISGNLSGDLGPGSYLVTGSCAIPFGDTLNIEPGTQILFTGHYRWTIFGTLLAEGTADNPIVFTRSEPILECQWAGLRFMWGASNNSILDYCVIEEANNKPSTSGGAIFSDGVSLEIKNTTIRNCQAYSGGAIFAWNYVGKQEIAINLTNCTIIDNVANNGGGLFFGVYAGGEIRNCTITRNTSDGT